MTLTTPVDQTSNNNPQPDPERVRKVVAELWHRVCASQPGNVGFPSTFDAIPVDGLWPLMGLVLNNVGDPWAESKFPAHTKELEREVVGTFADLLRAPADDRWGYVTTGGTEGVTYGLLLARTIYPNAIVYYSAAAHYSVPKVAAQLRMDTVQVRAGFRDTMDIDDLVTAMNTFRSRPAVVLATIGTTMTEAIDDVPAIRRALAEVPIPRAYIHADAALTGLPYALLTPPGEPLPFGLAAGGADSVSISGHKFLGVPTPCGVVVTRASLKGRMGGLVPMLNTLDTTVSSSRSGHAPLLMWYAFGLYGLDGLAQRARHARSTATYAVTRLNEIGWTSAYRHAPYAMTVVLRPPPPGVLADWHLPVQDDVTHIVCMPNITREQVDRFIETLAPHVGFHARP